MRVCLDIQAAIAQRAGVGRYTKLLAQHLAASADGDELLLFHFDFLRKGTPFEAQNASRKACRWCPGRMAQKAWKTISWPPFNFFAGDANVYHFPNFILPPLTKGKSVVTIHDMSFFRLPLFAEERNLRYLTSKIRDTVRRADAIVTDSQFSADEINSLLDVDRAKLFPIHPGISEDFTAPDKQAAKTMVSGLGLDRPYILTVGTLEPRKNIPFLVEVFESLSDFDGYLALVGMPGWKCEPILERIEKSPLRERIKLLRYVDDSALPALYAGAELFVLTSVYEGFGFPPLEAMACGAPVVSSSAGSLREALGDAALLIDRFEHDQWRGAMSRALSDTSLRAKMIADGHKQAAKYKWSETAKKTWKVYRSV